MWQAEKSLPCCRSHWWHRWKDCTGNDLVSWNIHVWAGFCFWSRNWRKGDSGFISWFDQRAEAASVCRALVCISGAVWVLVGRVVTTFEEAEFQGAVFWVIILLVLHHCVFSTGVWFVAVMWWVKSKIGNSSSEITWLVSLKNILMAQNIHTDYKVWCVKACRVRVSFAV